MKTLTLFLTLSILSLTAWSRKNFTANHAPHVYIMMKHGKMIEVRYGQRRLVKKNVVLVNESTIHPDGTIYVGSGQTAQLKEGQYITMDGRIRNLKDMPLH